MKILLMGSSVWIAFIGTHFCLPFFGYPFHARNFLAFLRMMQGFRWEEFEVSSTSLSTSLWFSTFFLFFYLCGVGNGQSGWPFIVLFQVFLFSFLMNTNLLTLKTKKNKTKKQDNERQQIMISTHIQPIPKITSHHEIKNQIPCRKAPTILILYINQHIQKKKKKSINHHQHNLWGGFGLGLKRKALKLTINHKELWSCSMRPLLFLLLNFLVLELEEKGALVLLHEL